MDPAPVRDKVTTGMDTRKIKEEDNTNIKVRKEYTCTYVKEDIHASNIHSGHNNFQNNEAYLCEKVDVKVKSEFLYCTEPLTLNFKTNDLDTSVTSKNLQNDQVSYAEAEDESSQSAHDTEPKQLEEEDDRKKKQCKVSCTVCKKTFPTSHKLYRHMSSHRLTCVVCDKVFRRKYSYEGHMREHAGEQTPYWCDLCEKKFSSITPLQAHHAMHAKRGKFDCSECGASYSQRDNYKAHMKLHADPKQNKCEVCGKQFFSPSNLRKHTAVHQDEKPYQCIVCDKGFSYKNTFDYHMKSHTGKERKKPHKCDVCGLSFGCKGAYTNHMNIHIGAKPFACGVCGITFAQLSSKQGHELTHSHRKQIVTETEEQRTQNIALSYDCNHCFLSFTRQIDLDHHLLKSHKVSQDDVGASSNHELYACGVCEKSYADPCELSTHMVETHCQIQGALNALSHGDGLTMGDKTASSTGVFICKICEKKFTKDAIKQHMRTHREKTSVCRICGMKFCGTGNLSRHMRLHTGETPYHCTKCDQKFRTTESLKKHLREHVGKQSPEKKYKCETCGKMFMDNYHLRRHSLTHMKKYKCKICWTNFVNIDMFEKHKLTHIFQ